jgi:hypothetical protein
LLAWFGHCAGPWSGFPSAELVPQSLLECYPPDALVRALESAALNQQHLEGAIRFMCRWIPESHRAPQKKLVELFRASPLREQLLQYVRSTGNEQKVRAVERRLA